MPRKVYDEQTKSAFLQAAIAARGTGKTWAETFQAAKEAGYTGSPQGIKKMLDAAAGKKRGTKKSRASKPVQKTPASAAATGVMAKRSGRPKGSKNKKAKSRMRYDSATKAKIIAAAKGKNLADAHAAAQEVGYKGSA